MERILLATDFSTRSDRALRRAILIAGQYGAALTLVHVVDDDQPDHLVSAQRAAASALLEESVRTIGEVDRVEAEAIVTIGDAFAAILRTMTDVDPDLVVIGPPRRQLLDVFAGTTAERIIRRSAHPVLMANAKPSGPYTRTLLAVDFDQASRSAIEIGRRLGFLERTEVAALHLFDAPALGMMKRSMQVPDAIDDYVEGERHRAAGELRSLLAATGLRHPRLVLEADRGSTASAILASAEEQDVDLIVVGSNRRKGLKRLLLGNVAEKMLLDAKCDVLVVPDAT